MAWLTFCGAGAMVVSLGLVGGFFSQLQDPKISIIPILAIICFGTSMCFTSVNAMRLRDAKHLRTIEGDKDFRELLETVIAYKEIGARAGVRAPTMKMSVLRDAVRALCKGGASAPSSASQAAEDDQASQDEEAMATKGKEPEYHALQDDVLEEAPVDEEAAAIKGKESEYHALLDDGSASSSASQAAEDEQAALDKEAAQKEEAAATKGMESDPGALKDDASEEASPDE